MDVLKSSRMYFIFSIVHCNIFFAIFADILMLRERAAKKAHFQMLHYVHVGQTQPSDAKMWYKHQQQQQQRKMSIWGEDKKKNRYPCVVEGYYRDWIWRISFMYTYGWDRPAIWRAGILSVHSLYVRIRHKIALHVVDVCVCFCVSCDIDRWEASEWPWRRWRRRRNVRGDWMGKNSLIKEDFPLSLPSYVWKLQYLQTAIDNKNSLL